MKTLTQMLLALTLLPTYALAAPNSELLKKVFLAAPSCGNFVRYDDAAIYTGFGPYKITLEEPRTAIPGEVDVLPLSGDAPIKLTTLDSAIDSVTNNGDLYVLTYSGIERWNLTSRTRTAVYPTTTSSGTLLYKQHAEAFARFGNTMIIAHGRLGVAFFDLQSNKITHQLPLLQEQAPQESMATGVTVQGHYAYVSMDNFTLGETIFRGIVVIDMQSETVVAELPGLDPGADALVSDGQTLIVSFSGDPIWNYTLSSIGLGAKTLPEPRQRVWNFPEKGNPTGRPAMDDLYYYTCYWRPPAQPGALFVSSPAVLDRKALNLN